MIIAHHQSSFGGTAPARLRMMRYRRALFLKAEAEKRLIGEISEEKTAETGPAAELQTEEEARETELIA